MLLILLYLTSVIKIALDHLYDSELNKSHFLRTSARSGVSEIGPVISGSESGIGIEKCKKYAVSQRPKEGWKISRVSR
jgi:hypothetical protein